MLSEFHSWTSNFIYFCWYRTPTWCLLLFRHLVTILTSSGVGGSTSPSVWIEECLISVSPVCCSNDWINNSWAYSCHCWSLWPCGVTCRSTATWLLGWRFRSRWERQCLSVVFVGCCVHNLGYSAIWGYTGCFTTCGHYCRRWFPRFLWSKKFI